MKTTPDSFSRMIGTSCGAFSLAFLSILATVSVGWFDWKATLVWLSGLLLGASLGYRFPRFGYGAAFGTVGFINLMVSMTIGRNMGEQAWAFLLFTFVQINFYAAHRIMSKRLLQ